MSAVSWSSSSRPRGVLRCVERCWPSAAQARRSETFSSRRTCSMQARRRAGPGNVSRGGLLEDQLVQGQLGDRPAQPAIFGLERLQAPDLVALEPAILLAPAVVGHLADADRAYGVGHALPPRDQDVHLAQLGDDLLGLVSLAR